MVDGLKNGESVPPNNGGMAAEDPGHAGGFSFNSASLEAPANFVPHFFTKFFSALVSLIFGDIEAFEYVEVFENRVTIAGHRQYAKQFGNGAARTGYFPFAYRVGPDSRRKPAELRHVRSGQGSAD
jgi:hypothetical protein